MSDLEALGFSDGDRVVVVHVDDIGMCDAANRGGVQALEGAATCGSVMVPCPAFEAIAKTAVGRPDLDLGVHLTLNAEYESYRWGPVADDVPGLCAPDGGMWRDPADTKANASSDEVERELRAQIDAALGAGIDVTHLDSHMGTVFDPKFVDVYAALAAEYRLPAFIPRVTREALEAAGMPDALGRYVDLIDRVENDGFTIFDHFDSNSLRFEPGTGANHNRARVDGLGAGVSYLITHCAQGGDELSSIAPDWRQRDEERQVYSDGAMADHFAAGNVVTIGMRPLRDLLRTRI
jgi:hypothetical protein